jgi:hypothetical protein
MATGRWHLTSPRDAKSASRLGFPQHPEDLRYMADREGANTRLKSITAQKLQIESDWKGEYPPDGQMASDSD